MKMKILSVVTLCTVSTCDYTTHCVDGVKYLHTGTGISVQYQPDGKVATCACEPEAK